MLTLGEGKHHVDGYILKKGIPAVFLDTGNFYENLVYRSNMQYDRERDILEFHQPIIRETTERKYRTQPSPRTSLIVFTRSCDALRPKRPICGRESRL